ncbi:hypothetical protein [Paraburkholderia sp. MM5477-R1]
MPGEPEERKRRRAAREQRKKAPRKTKNRPATLRRF